MWPRFTTIFQEHKQIYYEKFTLREHTRYTMISVSIRQSLTNHTKTHTAAGFHAMWTALTLPLFRITNS